MKKILVIALLGIGFLSTSFKSEKSIQFFAGSYEEALAKAKKEKKPLFLDFYADWCQPCKQMEKYSFTKPEFATLINEKFVPFKVNVEYFWGMDIVDKYGINTYPTIIFADKKGREIRRAVGFKSAEELEKLAKVILN